MFKAKLSEKEQMYDKYIIIPYTNPSSITALGPQVDMVVSV